MEENEIKIGDQTWTSKNLDVGTYRNGEVIPQVQDQEEWANLTTGAWCYYENESDNGTTYGKLYNWYALNDPRGLAPKGYHIPTDAEWTILTDYLGGDYLGGGVIQGDPRAGTGDKMKSTSGWQNNDNGNNISGFAGLPGGYRENKGNFYYGGERGYWWSLEFLQLDETPYAWYRNLYSIEGYVFRSGGFKQNGFSVRCLKD
jgi:uncharacterized protein (TIGR02145 family)